MSSQAFWVNEVQLDAFGSVLQKLLNAQCSITQVNICAEQGHQPKLVAKRLLNLFAALFVSL